MFFETVDVDRVQIREQQELLAMDRVEFFLLEDTQRALEPYEALWSLAAQVARASNMCRFTHSHRECQSLPRSVTRQTLSSVSEE